MSALPVLNEYVLSYCCKLFFTSLLQAMPADDGLFEGDVMLPEAATDLIIHSFPTFSHELKADAELAAVLGEHADGAVAGAAVAAGAEGDRSAIRVDKFRAVIWSSTVYFHIDAAIGE